MMKIKLLSLALFGRFTSVAGNLHGEVESFSNGSTGWAMACLVGLKKSKFDFLQTENYHLWYNDSSVIQLAQSGTFTGPDEMKEYVDFTKAKFFEYYKRVGDPEYFPIRFSEEECVMLVVVSNRMQVNASYGKPACLETSVGFKLHYTVADKQGNGFKISRTNLFYPGAFLHNLFGKALNSDGIRDYICDDVIKANCQEIWGLNALTSESCKLRYDSLQSTNEEGYIDDFTKGCRILHAAFAETNKLHCPHMSFLPIEDIHNHLWCQESGKVKAEDLFSVDELSLIKLFSKKKGYDKETLYKECQYVPPTTDNHTMLPTTVNHTMSPDTMSTTVLE